MLTIAIRSRLHVLCVGMKAFDAQVNHSLRLRSLKVSVSTVGKRGGNGASVSRTKRLKQSASFGDAERAHNRGSSTNGPHPAVRADTELGPSRSERHGSLDPPVPLPFAKSDEFSRHCRPTMPFGGCPLLENWIDCAQPPASPAAVT